MATQIPPLDNSFCNYVDDTPGGHFEMNTSAQIAGFQVFTGRRNKKQMTGWKERFQSPRKRVTNTINERQVKPCYRNSSWCERNQRHFIVLSSSIQHTLDGMLMIPSWLKQIECFNFTYFITPCLKHSCKLVSFMLCLINEFGTLFTYFSISYFVLKQY